jgi:hypothetical protein
MALTAWETYFEDRVTEAFAIQLKLIKGSRCGDFMAEKLENELKRFHNPDSAKTKQLFLDYLGVDVTASWAGMSTDAAGNRKALDAWSASGAKLCIDPRYRARVCRRLTWSSGMILKRLPASSSC